MRRFLLTVLAVLCGSLTSPAVMPASAYRLDLVSHQPHGYTEVREGQVIRYDIYLSTPEPSNITSLSVSLEFNPILWEHVPFNGDKSDPANPDRGTGSYVETYYPLYAPAIIESKGGRAPTWLVRPPRYWRDPYYPSPDDWVILRDDFGYKRVRVEFICNRGVLSVCAGSANAEYLGTIALRARLYADYNV